MFYWTVTTLSMHLCAFRLGWSQGHNCLLDPLISEYIRAVSGLIAMLREWLSTDITINPLYWALNGMATPPLPLGHFYVPLPLNTLVLI